MDRFDSDAHSFVIKVWVEDAPGADGGPTWRGHITHVPSKNRRYVEDIDGFDDFIVGYLKKMGIEPRPSRTRPKPPAKKAASIGTRLRGG